MSSTFEVRSAETGDLLDTVTFGDGVTYATGEAQDLVESRMRLLLDTSSAFASLDGWSNGYVTIVQVDDPAARLAGDRVVLREPGGAS